jgi:signal transduction histidine kinase/CheY-like chemotaxis protein
VTVNHSPDDPPQHRLFVALMLAATLSASLLIGYLLWSARQDALIAAQVTALNYARTLEVRLEGAFRRTDAALQTVVHATPPQALAPGGEREYALPLNRNLDSLISGFDELIALRVIDSRGDQRYVTSASTSPPVNYADRSFFQRYTRDPQAQLLFSEVLTGRVSRQATVVITRPLRDTDGRFFGAVLAPMDLGYFLDQFRKLQIGGDGVVFLRRREQGELVLRWPQIDAEVNRPMPPDQPILRAVQAGREESVNEYQAFTDGVYRISGTVAVKGYPFFLTVALSKDEALAPWRRLALLAGASWTALLAVTYTLLRRAGRAQRTRRELEAQLREAQRIEALGTLAGGIAHDFNNIVAAILGNVALARGEIPADHPAQRTLEQIRRAGTRARGLVQQILAFGRHQLHVPVNQPLQPLIEEAVSLLRPTLPATVTLELSVVAEPLHALVDATQMQQVLINLCTNAWHALEGRRGRVCIGLEALDVDDPRRTAPGTTLAPGRYAHLWVQDDGVGMDAATQARIFEPFFTTKPTGVGTGLGLPVVHGIVVAHHGVIRIDSTPQQGTVVHLYFPAVDAAALPGVEEHVEAEAAGRGQHVLYADDDEVIVLVVERLLAQAGYRVTALRDGRAAVAAVQTDPEAWDLVVTDFNMPAVTGLEVARAVKAARPGLPVIISSGYITDALRAQAASAGVSRLVHKQNMMEELLPAVRELLAH